MVLFSSSTDPNSRPCVICSCSSTMSGFPAKLYGFLDAYHLPILCSACPPPPYQLPDTLFRTYSDAVKSRQLSCPPLSASLLCIVHSVLILSVPTHYCRAIAFRMIDRNSPFWSQTLVAHCKFSKNICLLPGVNNELLRINH